MRVLVTGGLGFVGRVVAARLASAGHWVAVMTRAAAPADLPPGVRSVARGDLLGRPGLERLLTTGRFEAVCHLAAVTRVRESRADPARTWAVNAAGTATLLSVLSELGPVKFVLASSTTVYGPLAPVPTGEEAPLAPAGVYASSKAGAEQTAGEAAADGWLGAVTLRMCNVAGAVGGGDPDDTRLLPAALATAAGRRDAFALNGDGSVVREFVHVADVADAWLLAVEAATPGRHLVYNVGSGVGVSIREVLDTVERVTGRQVPVETRPPADEPPLLVADSTRIRTELGWAPRRSSMEEIVADAWAALAGLD
jgi:UDP-glucose 4-epimerase